MNMLIETTMVECVYDGVYAVQKLAKYANRCANVGLAFLPMAVDIVGGWHTEVLNLIPQVAGR